ncbi:hypothetical protein ACFWXO_04590 [Kitasatospora sp. NPDC059088]|uniref:hypothetical protein n=1 Tax=Kitasatospora sp. NPDC059088 TaxID=3346722 RepID=UPI003686ED03
MLLLLGLLLTAASGTFAGLLIADNLSGGPEYQVTVLGNDLVTLNSLGVFLSGVALALLFCLGLALIGLTRRAPRRRPRPITHRAPYRRARPAQPIEPVEPLAPPVEAETPAPERRAAEQGGRAAGMPEAEPARGGRIRHLFGH